MSLRNMKFADRVAFQRRRLEELIAEFPREVEAYRHLFRATWQEDAGTTRR